jgi:hypothetical protein
MILIINFPVMNRAVESIDDDSRREILQWEKNNLNASDVKDHRKCMFWTCGTADFLGHLVIESMIIWIAMKTTLGARLGFTGARLKSATTQWIG